MKNNFDSQRKCWKDGEFTLLAIQPHHLAVHVWVTATDQLCWLVLSWHTWSKKSPTHTWVRRSRESVWKSLLWRMVHVHPQYVSCTLSPVSAVYRTSFSNVLFDILTNHRYIPMCQISLKQIVSAWITLMHFYLIQGKEADTWSKAEQIFHRYLRDILYCCWFWFLVL